MGISIGKDKSIIWINQYNSDPDDTFEMDGLLEPSIVFWDKLETQCVSECCGINAYCFWEEDILSALESVDRFAVLQNLLFIKTEIAKRKETVLLSKRLNDYFDKSVFIQLLDHILAITQR